MKLLLLPLLFILTSGFAVPATADECHDTLRAEAPYKSMRTKAEDVIMSEVPTDAKLLAISQYQELGLNCREEVHAALMRITVYSHAKQTGDAVEEAKALVDARPLPVLQKHFTRTLIDLYIENNDGQSAEPYIDVLVQSRPQGFENTQLPQSRIAQYVDKYVAAHAYKKAVDLALELQVVRPFNVRRPRSEKELNSLKKVMSLLISEGRLDLVEALKNDNAVFWVDRCPGYQFSEFPPYECHSAVRLGDFLEPR